VSCFEYVSGVGLVEIVIVVSYASYMSIVSVSGNVHPVCPTYNFPQVLNSSL